MVSISFIFGTGLKGLSFVEAAKRSSRKYVRGEDAVAVYEKFRNPTGHIMTAWEAYTTFGPEILEEAVEYGSAILPENSDDALKGRRKALNLARKSVARAALVKESDMNIAETAAYKVSIQKLERIAFALGLDERMLAVKKDAGGDDSLAYRLRTLQTPMRESYEAPTELSPRTALLFAEAASIIRVQHRLQKWLGIETEIGDFHPSDDYGSYQNPVWRVGRNLADDARRILELDDAPIQSMREIVEVRLGIPLIQARLPKAIAGATIMTTDDSGDAARGIILNADGANRDARTLRLTLARELCHLLYDPDEHLQRVRVTYCEDLRADPQSRAADRAEQRANAFASAFLGPLDESADDSLATEDFALDYFPIPSAPDQRRGRFAGIVAAACGEGLITDHTAALYLGCDREIVGERIADLRSPHGV